MFENETRRALFYQCERGGHRNPPFCKGVFNSFQVWASEAAGRDAVIDFLQCGWSLDCRVSSRGIQF